MRVWTARGMRPPVFLADRCMMRLTRSSRNAYIVDPAKNNAHPEFFGFLCTVNTGRGSTRRSQRAILRVHSVDLRMADLPAGGVKSMQRRDGEHPVARMRLGTGSMEETNCVVEDLDSRGRQVGRSPRPSIVLAEDHEDLLQEMYELLSPEFEVVRLVRGGAALVDAALELRPDVVVSDINMPGLNGIDAGRSIRRQGACDTVILLTVFREPQLVRCALEAGIRGYVLKLDAGEELIAAVKSVLAGNTYLSRGIAGLDRACQALQ